MANYIGPTGLNYLWGKMKNLVSGKANTADLATVATSGSYTDLDNLPVIPAAVTENTVSGWGFTKNTGTVTSTNNAVTNIAVVSALPASPDANTLYLITGS